MNNTIRGRNIVPAAIRPLLRRIGGVAEEGGVRVFAVGGCVRDWLLGRRRSPDLDLTVEGDAIAFASRVAAILKGSLEIHQQFGTASLRLPHRRVDFATCRKEHYVKPAAYPTVSAGTLNDDLFRRDFTINAIAMAMNPQRFGRLVDPFRGGQDLRQRRLRILHERSFLDDPSRLLRGVRFAQRFGLRWEPRTERAAREALRAGALGWLNVGRLRKELDRMLQEPNPRACLEGLAILLKP